MKNVKNILLDLDGTLTDPKEGITKSIQHALQRLQLAVPSMDELEWTIGPPLTHIFSNLLETDNSARIQAAVRLYRERYVHYCAIENKPYEGIHHTLAALKAHGYKLYLATSKPWEYARKILHHFQLDHYFDEVHGSELDGTRDYKEELIGYVLDQHKLHHLQTLMIGDRHYDIQGAKYNKVRSIGVTYGYGSLAEITSAAPDAICHAHTEIPALLKL